ncbi:hypothetical protein [Alitiscatomonas aceti]|uniref:Adhesin domain-containing protein n=1 Tax=Alitiscatomonas aceti TaxID=2981724 RepID=A0ABT2UW71_9FIRM|nr:hypothetical protein [Alitiscatomonas aceti]MCU6798893.1 hypothetical protein [Alitiscatomonas aceti]
MAIFMQGSQNMNFEDAKDMRELKAYLFQNNEWLRYMFNNIDEDNYSPDMLKKYIERGNAIATLEFDVNGLRVGLKDLEEDVNTKFELVDSRITLEISNVKKEISTKVELLDGKITLAVQNAKTYTDTQVRILDGKIELKVSVGDVSNQLSVEKGGITIKGERLTIDTKNLQVSPDGKLSCSNATFDGLIKGGEIKIGYTDELDRQWYMLHVTERSLNIGNCEIVFYNDRYIWQTDDEWCGMSPEMADRYKPERLSLWANYDIRTKKAAFSVSQQGNTRIKTLYVEGTQHWPDQTLASVLDYIWEDPDYGIRMLGHEVRSLQDQVNELYNMVNGV